MSIPRCLVQEHATSYLPSPTSTVPNIIPMSGFTHPAQHCVAVPLSGKPSPSHGLPSRVACRANPLSVPHREGQVCLGYSDEQVPTRSRHAHATLTLPVSSASLRRPSSSVVHRAVIASPLVKRCGHYQQYHWHGAAFSPLVVRGASVLSLEAKGSVNVNRLAVNLLSAMAHLDPGLPPLLRYRLSRKEAAQSA